MPVTGVHDARHDSVIQRSAQRTGGGSKRATDERATSGAQGQDVDGRPGGDPDRARPEGISVEDVGALIA